MGFAEFNLHPTTHTFHHGPGNTIKNSFVIIVMKLNLHGWSNIKSGKSPGSINLSSGGMSAGLSLWLQTVSIIAVVFLFRRFALL